MSKKRYDVSEDNLKDLQRKDALRDSEEYDINDDTYERGHLTRQYVEDDIVVKGGELIDDDVVVVAYDDESHDNEIYVFDDEDSSSKQPERIVDTPAVNIPKFTPIVPVTNKGDETTKNDHVLDESERDYLDRDYTLKEDDKFEKTEKKKSSTVCVKPKKTSAQTIDWFWLKPVLVIASFIFAFILALFLFNTISDFGQKNAVNDRSLSYIDFVNDTNDLLSYENTLCREFKNATEQYLVGDVVSQEEYMAKLETLRSNLTQASGKYSVNEYSLIDVYEIKFLVVDYTKTLVNTIDVLLAAKGQTDVTIKNLILNNVNDKLSSREQQFNNISSLLSSTAEQYDISSKFKNNILYLDVELPE